MGRYLATLGMCRHSGVPDGTLLLDPDGWTPPLSMVISGLKSPPHVRGENISPDCRPFVSRGPSPRVRASVHITCVGNRGEEWKVLKVAGRGKMAVIASEPLWSN